LAGHAENFYLVQIPIRGAVQVSLGDDRVLCQGTMPAVISPGERCGCDGRTIVRSLSCRYRARRWRRALRNGSAFKQPRRLRFHSRLRFCAFGGARLAGAASIFTVRSIDAGGCFPRTAVRAPEDTLLPALLRVQRWPRLDVRTAGDPPGARTAGPPGKQPARVDRSHGEIEQRPPVARRRTAQIEAGLKSQRVVLLEAEPLRKARLPAPSRGICTISCAQLFRPIAAATRSAPARSPPHGALAKDAIVAKG